MANTDNPLGFVWVDNVGGEAQFQTYKVADTNSTAIFRGDPISILSDGTVQASAAGDGDIVVAIAGASKDSTGNSLLLTPALTAATIRAIPVKNQVFEIQAATGVVYDAEDVNETADFVVGVGNPNTGRSRYELNTAGGGNQVRIMGLASKVAQENEFGQENATVRVAFVEDAYSNNTSV